MDFSPIAMVAAGHDEAFASRLGPIKGVEFNFLGHEDDTDQLVEVRIHTSQGQHDAHGVRLATITGGRWQWRSSTGEPSEPFRAEQPYHPDLLLACRAAVAGNPVLTAEQATALGPRQAVVAVEQPGTINPSEAVMAGIARFSGHIDEPRAVAGVAHHTGWDPQRVRWEGDRVVSTGSRQPEQVLADAFYLAVEHHLHRTGRFPDLRVEATGTQATCRSAHCSSGHFTAALHPIAVLTPSSWRWAWAVAELEPHATAAQQLYRFGRDFQLADLVRPEVPLQRARRAHLAQMAMPILGVWDAVEVELAGHRVLALIDAPELSLPPLTHAAEVATLAIAPPEGVNPDAAVGAYRAQR